MARPTKEGKRAEIRKPSGDGENRQVCDLNLDKNWNNLQSYTYIPFQKHHQGLLHSCMKSGTIELRKLLKKG